MVSFENLRNDSDVIALVEMANHVLGEIGYTEHGMAHAIKVGEDASRILSELGYDEHLCELAKIAGLLHDTGNVVNRANHAHSGAFMAYDILKSRGFPFADVIEVTTAIGHHDEATAAPVTPLAAALILADKSDVRTSRVRNRSNLHDDIHDRVNYAVFSSKLDVDRERRLVVLSIKIDTLVCPVMEYFEIFLERMLLCKKSAAALEGDFELIINDTRLL